MEPWPIAGGLPPGFAEEVWNLGDDDLFHGQAHGCGRAGHGEHDLLTKQSADGAAEDGGWAYFLVTEQAKDFAVAWKGLGQQAADRFIGLVAAGDARAAGQQDYINVIALA